jgi:hypothetical protein
MKDGKWKKEEHETGGPIRALGSKRAGAVD